MAPRLRALFLAEWHRAWASRNSYRRIGAQHYCNGGIGLTMMNIEAEAAQEWMDSIRSIYRGAQVAS